MINHPTFRLFYTYLIIAATMLAACLPNELAAQIPPTTTTFPADKNVVEIPFTRYRSWIVIEVGVNGKDTLSFILDTGAPIALLADPDLVEPLGLNVVGQANVAGVDGQPAKTVPLAAGTAFTVGGLTIENGMVALGAAQDAISGVDGVIGKYFFEHAVVRINWRENKLIVYHPDHFTYDGRGTVVPFKTASTGHIYTQLEVDINGRSQSVSCIIDTGNRSTFKVGPIATDLADLKALEDVIVGWGANGPAYGDVHRVGVTLAGIHLPEVIASSGAEKPDRLAQEGIPGNIGLSILERFDLVFDYPGSRLILEKNDRFPNEFTYNRSGIVLHPKRQREHVVVAGLLPNSPATDNDLRQNDQIVSINGKKVDQYSTDEIDGLVTGRTGEEIELAIRRGEELLSKRIKLKKLI